MRTIGKVLIAGVMILASSIGPVGVAEAQPPIRIGASLAQSGVYAALGQNQLRGYQLCVKHMNEKGGVLGRRLELVLYDDGSDPATAPILPAGTSRRQVQCEFARPASNGSEVKT